MATERAMFAAGCFWGVEAAFRQVPDIGTQYRSAIFYLTPEQEAAARASKERAQARFERPIVTEITKASTFWPAEDYHQRYFEKHGMVGCAIPPEGSVDPGSEAEQAVSPPVSG